MSKLSDYLHTAEAAEYLGVLPPTLTNWRCTRKYPLPFIKVGRLVRYRIEDVERFLESRTVGVAGE